MPEQELDQVISYREKLVYDTPDDDLIIAINKAMVESKDLKERIDEIGKTNKLYWKKGTNKDLSRVHPKKSKIISNRIFTDIETSIPILTSEPPEPEIIGEIDNDLRERLQKGLQFAYEVKYKLQQKLQQLVRHWFLFRLGVWKYRWDKDKGFTTDNVLARKIGFDKFATCLDNCEYFWEEMEITVEELIAKFSKKKKELTAIFSKENLKSKVKYLEFWGGQGEWVCWRFKNIILDKKKNPNFNYDIEENNIFEKPRFPYILFNVFTLGDETGMYDETSLIEEASSLQEGVNQLEQQILDLNEGQKRVWVSSGEAMSSTQAQDLINETGDLMVYFDRKAPVGALTQVQSGKPDASLFNNLSHLLGEIDNVIGVHSTTRGERKETETLGGRKLLMGSDYGRLDLIVRNIEQAMEDWYNAYLQMLKVYSSETEVLSNGKETIELNAEEIPSHLKVMIKKGSTLPTDRLSKMNNAIQLAGANMIDPQTLFEEMGYPNSQERVQKLFQWLQMTGKILPQAPQTSPGTPQGAPQGQAEGGQQGEQLTRLEQILTSPQFQQLPDEQKLEIIQKGREVSSAIKGQ